MCSRDTDAILASATPMTASADRPKDVPGSTGTEVPLRPNVGLGDAADLLHRAAGGWRCPFALDGPPADRHAGDHGALGARTSRFGSRRGWRGERCRRRAPAAAHPVSDVEINRPDALVGTRSGLADTRLALIGERCPNAPKLSRQGPDTIRYGAAENLYGEAEIAAFRAARSSAGLRRRLDAHGA